MYQAEQENVAVKAVHRGETLAESGAKSLYRRHKAAPYRRLERLTRKTTRLKSDAAYRQTLADNPKLRSSVLSRAAQKRRIQRQYAKVSKDAKKTASAAKKTGDIIGKAAQAVVQAVVRHPMVLGIIAMAGLLIVMISSLFSFCSNMTGGLSQAVAAASYLAEDADIVNAELAYLEWEAELQAQISGVQEANSGFDEYRLSAGNVGHSPYELMAYLTAHYHNFTFAAIESDLRALFDEQYSVFRAETTETRYADPDDADGDGDLKPYSWHVLTVELTARSLTDVVSSRMSDAERQNYDVLMRTSGHRQYFGSPLASGWLPRVTGYDGKSAGIAALAGTEVLAVLTGAASVSGGTVTLFDGNGLVCRYARLGSVVIADGQTVVKSDVIGMVGNEPILFEIFKDGNQLNPLFFAAVGGAGALAYGNPGAAMGDGSYAALIAEAELHLGKWYVFGSDGPDAFDCSSFVSYVFTKSEVCDLPRTDAQGIFNQCEPVAPADAKPGDVVTFSGTYSSLNVVTHIGIFAGWINDRPVMIHAGSPVQYSYIDTPYYQNHFYSFARLPGL
ncbi:MAG: C40 family peptidase [Clostridiales bacterium]|jgi:hypothetical protein|nr:C40 family peptidase [Clostridiales bacterium]